MVQALLDVGRHMHPHVPPGSSTGKTLGIEPRGPLRAGHGIPSSTGGISDLSRNRNEIPPSNKLSREGFCRNPRGIFPTKFPGEFCCGFFWAIFFGPFSSLEKTGGKNPPKNPRRFSNQNLGVSGPKSTHCKDGGGKTGSICHFPFSLVLQCLGVPRYPDAGKTARKVSLSHPFLCAPNASKN